MDTSTRSPELLRGSSSVLRSLHGDHQSDAKDDTLHQRTRTARSTEVAQGIEWKYPLRSSSRWCFKPKSGHAQFQLERCIINDLSRSPRLILRTNFNLRAHKKSDLWGGWNGMESIGHSRSCSVDAVANRIGSPLVYGVIHVAMSSRVFAMHM